MSEVAYHNPRYGSVTQVLLTSSYFINYLEGIPVFPVKRELNIKQFL